MAAAAVAAQRSGRGQAEPRQAGVAEGGWAAEDAEAGQLV